MSHSQEPSYYEIALTNRQVLGFFVVLLLCVVGAFFSGIWLGKKQSVGETVVAQAEPVIEQTAAEEEPLQELNFFTDDKPDQAPARPAAAEREQLEPPPAPQPEPQLEAAASSSTTLAEDLESAVRTRRAAEQAAAEPAATEPSATEPRVEDAETRQGITSETLPTRSIRPSGGYVIQVFSSQDGIQAQRLVDRLVAGGYDAFVLTDVIDGRTMHRVRIGPFADQSEAKRVEPRVKADFNLDTWVTRNE